MKPWLFLLMFAVLAAFASGCASTKSDNDVSTIPWNRPQDWEGTGALGGMHPPGSP